MVAVGGVAALSWEILWQLRSTLAIGVSALGASITLAATMAGMTVGSLTAGRVLARRSRVRAVRSYGILELVIGVSGLLMLSGFAMLEVLDAWLYRITPELAPAIHLLGMALVLGPPTFSMGATVPVFQLLAQSHGTSIARLYALNTAGAATGVVLISFALLPSLGVARATAAVAFLNLAVFAASRVLPASRLEADPRPLMASPTAVASGAGGAPSFPTCLLLVFGTGFATFGLEVSWFRSLRAAFQSTTDGFAIMLTAVLVSLALGARLVPWALRRGLQPGALLAAAAVAILLATPLVERADLYVPRLWSYWLTLACWLLGSILVLGPAIVLLGMVLPWCLETFPDPARTGRLYAFNTLGAVAGSLLAAWLFLPAAGFARTSWGVAAGVAVLALVASRPSRRPAVAVATAAALGIAMLGTSSVGRDRVQGFSQPARILGFEEAEDSTVSAVEGLEDGSRYLVIDGFAASSEDAASHYMQWMGRLPMLLHPSPRRALVICFGTGQTANAVREEGAERVDVVDVSDAVFAMAGHFSTNRGVLEDPRVRRIVMDGRAWMRRVDHEYDVMTLEPMPPTFAGVNALYSTEFYELMAAKLAPGGVVAQWLPVHLLTPEATASVTASFARVFPDAVLWIDPVDTTGILVGRQDPGRNLLEDGWPGLGREVPTRTLDANDVRRGVILTPREVARFTARAEPVTDDNQLLAYRGNRERAVIGAAALQMRESNLYRIQQLARRYVHAPGASAMRRPIARSPWPTEEDRLPGP